MSNSMLAKLGDNFAQSNEFTQYLAEYEVIKEILNKATITLVNNMVLVYSPTHIRNKQKAIMIRVINFSHKGKKIIALNNTIIYLPPEIKGVQTSDLINHINSNIQQTKINKELIEYFRFFKLSWLVDLIYDFMRVLKH